MDDQKLKNKNSAEICLIKNFSLLIPGLGLLKGRPSYRRSLQNFFQFLWVIFSPPHKSGSRRDPFDSGSDPDSQHCFFSGGSLILTNIYLLVGVSIPIWIWPHPFTSRPPLPLYAGAEEIAAEHACIKSTV